MMSLAQFVVLLAPHRESKSFPRLALFAGLVFLAALSAMGPQGLAQALPAAEAAPISTGFALPHTAGTLNYAVSAAESLTWGYYGNQGVFSATNLNGDIGYLSNSKVYPFSMVFSGGYSWATSSQPSYGYLNLSLSQVINAKRWTIIGSDAVSYLPGTASTGLSGVPGVGDLGVSLGTDVNQGVLTSYSDRVSNTATGNVQRQLTGKTSFNAFGSYGVLRFLGVGSEGLDSNSVSGGGGITHEMSERNSFSGNYSYSSYTYPGNSAVLTEPGFTSQTASGEYSHKFTRRLSVTVSAGPQWTALTSSGSSQQLSLYANATASYHTQFSQWGIYYLRSTNNGFGVIAGGLSQGGGITAGRTFARVWNCSASGSYTQTTGLPGVNSTAYAFDTTTAGVQTSRAIVRSVSAFASYTFLHQTSGSGSAVDVFSGSEQVLGFGVTYSPASIHVGRQ